MEWLFGLIILASFLLSLFIGAKNNFGGLTHIKSKKDTNKIYVKLLDEEVIVHTPVPAEKIYKNIYKIEGDSKKAYAEYLENWEFKTGEMVRCEEGTFKDNPRELVMIAKELIETS